MPRVDVISDQLDSKRCLAIWPKLDVDELLMLPNPRHVDGSGAVYPEPTFRGPASVLSFAPEIFGARDEPASFLSYVSTVAEFLDAGELRVGKNGNAAALEASGDYNDRLGDYLARFPDAVGLEPAENTCRMNVFELPALPGRNSYANLMEFRQRVYKAVAPHLGRIVASNAVLPFDESTASLFT